MRTTLFLAFSVLLAPAIARGHVGIVRLREASGTIVITAFTAADPLRAGPIDASVLVQDRQTGAVVLDATVKLEIRPVSGGRPIFLIFAKSEAATNKLLKAARIDLPAGSWILRLYVLRGHQTAVFATNLQVAAAEPRLSGIWPLLIIPPFAIGLFTLHQMLRHPAIHKMRSGATYMQSPETPAVPMHPFNNSLRTNRQTK